MSAVAAHFPVAPNNPEPSRAAPAAPTAINRVLSVVRRLIDIGMQLAGTVQQRATAPGFAVFAMPFGTADLAIILARITGGLRLAAALEGRLCRRAERGQDLAPPPPRPRAARTPRAASQSAPTAAAAEPQATDTAEHPRLAALPTEAQIAAAVRRRPVGAVIADICHDLGITPGHLDREFWDELSSTIVSYGGDLARFFIKMNRRVFAFDPGKYADCADPLWPAAPSRSPTPATGPP